MFVTYKNRHMFIYGMYSTYEKADESLGDSYAEGDISPADSPEIALIRGKFCILILA